MEEREEKTKRLPIWVKILIAGAAVAAVFLTVFLLRDVPPFNQYKLFLDRTVNSAVNDKERTETVEGRVVEEDDFAEMDKELPFKVTRPLWMPDGFGLEYADYKERADEKFDISYRYTLNGNSEEFIQFTMRDYLPIDPEGYTVDFEEFTIKEMKVYLLNLGEDGIQAEYINNQGLVVTMTGTIDQKTLIKIIENMS